MGTLAHPAIVISGVVVHEAGSLITEYPGESTSTNFSIYNPMGNQFKGTLDLDRLRTFIRMAAVQPLIIVRFFIDPLNLAIYYMLFSCRFIHLISFKPRSNKGERYLDPLIRVFENLLGAINFQNFWGVCNIESISTFISILGFRVVCATCGRQVQRPEFRLARSK